jgi:hypothetical protein
VLRTTRPARRGCREYETRRRPLRSRSQVPETRARRHRQSAAGGRLATRPASLFGVAAPCPPALQALFAPLDPIPARSKSRSVVCPMTAQKWSGRVGASPIWPRAIENATKVDLPGMRRLAATINAADFAAPSPATTPQQPENKRASPLAQRRPTRPMA